MVTRTIVALAAQTTDMTALTPTARLQQAQYNATALNEIIPHGVSDAIAWKRAQYVTMGTEPHASTVPKNWGGPVIQDWTAIVPWFIAYEDETRNKSTTTQVEVSGIELWTLGLAGKWTKLCSALPPEWCDPFSENAINTTTSTSPIIRTSNGNTFRPGKGVAYHGGLHRVPTPWNAQGADILAIYASVRHRLVLDGADDPADVYFGVECGVDYWPSMTATLADVAPATYIPGAGDGRFMRAKANWQYSTFYCKKTGVTDAQILGYAPPTFVY